MLAAAIREEQGTINPRCSMHQKGALSNASRRMASCFPFLEDKKCRRGFARTWCPPLSCPLSLRLLPGVPCMGKPNPSAPCVPCPPTTPRLWLPFLLVRPGQQLACTFASASWWACYTHYRNPHTLYCPGQARGRCTPACPPGAPRWTAYTVVAVGAAGAPHLLHWHQAAHTWCPALEERQGKLRGQGVLLRRLGNANNSPLRLEFTADARCTQLPPVEDVRCYLSRLWQVDL